MSTRYDRLETELTAVKQELADRTENMNKLIKTNQDLAASNLELSTSNRELSIANQKLIMSNEQRLEGRY